MEQVAQGPKIHLGAIAKLEQRLDTSEPFRDPIGTAGRRGALCGEPFFLDFKFETKTLGESPSLPQQQRSRD